MNKPQKYVKIPVTVEAMQWTRETTMKELKDFTNNLVELDDVEEEFQVYDRLHDTWIWFKYGDWIIKGLKGEFYPCVDETFQGSYRPEMFTEDDDLMTDEEMQERVKPKKGKPRKGNGEIQIVTPPYPVPAPIAQAIADHERRRWQDAAWEGRQ